MIARVHGASAALVLSLALGGSACSRPSDADQVKGAAVAVDTSNLGTDPGKTIPAFTMRAEDLASGKSRELHSHELRKPAIYLVLGTHCPSTQKYLDRIRELEAAYRPKGVEFIYLYPNKTETRDEKIAFHKEKGFAGTFVDDSGAKISAFTLMARKTSEIVIAGADGKIVYRGSVDDNRDPAKVTRKHAALALDEHLAGTPVTQTTAPVFA